MTMATRKQSFNRIVLNSPIDLNRRLRNLELKTKIKKDWRYWLQVLTWVLIWGFLASIILGSMLF